MESLTEQSSTYVVKGFNGWKASTSIDQLNGYDWELRTFKQDNGVVISYAQGGKRSGTGIFQFALHQDPNVTLIKNPCARVTKKIVEQQHAQALLLFDAKKDAGELPSRSTLEPVFGQLVHASQAQPLVVIGNKDGRFGKEYILLDTVNLTTTTISEIEHGDQGRGMYFNENEVYPDLDQLANLILESETQKQHKEQEAQTEHLLNKAKTDGLIAEGKSKVTIPEGVQSVVVAYEKTDVSDGHTDYFNHTSSAPIYLAFSSNTRDNFSEMRSACRNAEDENIKSLENAPKDWEHREKYAMGRGYYLSERRHSGIEIRKEPFISSNQEHLNQLYIAAAEGRYFIPDRNAVPVDQTTTSDLFEMKETIHAKKNVPLCVAVLKDRVDRDHFLRLKSIAKSHNGYYSSFARNGAIPGFQFFSESERSQFIANASKS